MAARVICPALFRVTFGGTSSGPSMGRSQGAPLTRGPGGYRTSTRFAPACRGAMLPTAMEPTSPVPLRILLAEDDAGLAKLYATFAKGRGHSVSLAQDGIETLSVALSELPDVILLDVQMPALDGRDVLAQLKADPRTAAIPVLVVSALGGDQHMRDQLVELGASDVMEKPVDLHIAFNKAERLVRG